MYIKANHFDYDALLTGIVDRLDLQDNPLDDETIKKVFIDFQARHKVRTAANQLEPWQETIVLSLLNSVQHTQNYVDAEENSDPTADDFYILMGKILNTLGDCLTGTNDDLLVGYLEHFLDWIGNGHVEGVTLDNEGDYVLANGATLKSDQFANFLRDWTERYLTAEISELDKFLLHHINNNIGYTEYLKSMTVLDLPGPKVKYGDSVITFPSILLEVHNL